MATISSKSELASMAASLVTKSKELEDLAEELKPTLNSVQDYDGINVTEAANTIINNLDNLTEDLDSVVTNISNYSTEINNFDVNDFGGNSVEGYLSSTSGRSIALPSGLGSVHAYMGWQCITAKNSLQYKLREAAGMNFDEEGFGKIGDRYVVATTTTYGNIGDYIDVVQADGSVIKCIIGDIKNQNDAGCNQWGHNNGQCVVEFVVDAKSWYGKKDNPGTPSNHPEWSQNITQIVNKGNYFDLSGQYDTSVASSTGAQTVSSGSTNSVSAAVAPATAVAATTAAVAKSSGSSSGGGSYSGGSHSGGNSATTTLSAGQASSVASTPIQTSQPVQSTPITTTEVQTSSGDPNIDISKYHENKAAGFEVTVGNTAYNLNDNDFELLCAIVSAESDKSYDDALAVISTILNRCEAPNWVASHGTNPVSQATAPNQFVVYQHGSYKSYMNGNAPETVKIAVRDALAGVRNHRYLSFRSNGSTGFSANMITASGNRYK